MRIEEAVDRMVDTHPSREWASAIAASLVDPSRETVSGRLPTLVGITGYARNGKDTVGGRFEKRGFKKFAFADALKSMAVALNPIVGYIAGLTTDAPYLEQRLAKLVEDIGWEGAKTYPEVRRFLQVLGTEAVRDHLGEDSWVHALEKSVTESDTSRVVVTDVRFPNEAAWIRARGGRLIRVVRFNEDGTEYDNGVPRDHGSEKHVPNLPVDAEVSASNLEDLLRLADALVDQTLFGEKS